MEGGSANDYDYCTGDPVNCTDLAGEYQYRIRDRFYSNHLDRTIVLRYGDTKSGWNHIQYRRHDRGWGGYSYTTALRQTIALGSYYEEGSPGVYEAYFCFVSADGRRERTFYVLMNTTRMRKYSDRMISAEQEDEFMMGVITAYWLDDARSI